MIHRITYEDGSYNEWYEPGRVNAEPRQADEPDFFRRVQMTATRASTPAQIASGFVSFTAESRVA